MDHKRKRGEYIMRVRKRQPRAVIARAATKKEYRLDDREQRTRESFGSYRVAATKDIRFVLRRS